MDAVAGWLTLDVQKKKKQSKIEHRLDKAGVVGSIPT